MESFERGTSESQEFSDDDSVIINRTPENLTSVFHLKEPLDTFSEMSLAESPVSRQMESEVGAKHLLNSRLNKASKQRTLSYQNP